MDTLPAVAAGILPPGIGALIGRITRKLPMLRFASGALRRAESPIRVTDRHNPKTIRKAQVIMAKSSQLLLAGIAQFPAPPRASPLGQGRSGLASSHPRSGGNKWLANAGSRHLTLQNSAQRWGWIPTAFAGALEARVGIDDWRNGVGAK